MANYLYDLHSLEGKYGAFTAQVNETNGIDRGQIVKPGNTSTEATTTNYNQGSGIIEVSLANANGDEALTCGIALKDADDNEQISVATRGIFLMQANAAIDAGKAVGLMSGGDTTASKLEVIAAGARPFGIALTSCNAQNEYVLVLVTHFGWSADGAETA